jgi:site-specific DNA-methyltransferase (adenine-specific)
MNNTENDIKDKLNAMKHSYKCEQIGGATLFNEDNLTVLKELPDNSIDSVVTDGPYGWKKEGDNFKPEAIRKGTTRGDGSGISPSMFSGNYDKSRTGAIRFQQYSYNWAVELIRILKPGAMLISCCSADSYHRMATGIQDAGFEIRDQLQWLCAQSHCYSRKVGYYIDNILGAEREVVGPNPNRKGRKRNWSNTPKNLTLPATREAERWEGWATRLRQTNEPILLARKPLADGSVVRNVMKFGTGALNIDSCKYGEQNRYPTNTIISEKVAEILAEKGKYFYCPKVSKRERHAGCEHLKKKNSHSTVKPMALMEYLVKLVTPPNGICIDIFAGSGSTGIACSKEGFGFIGIELEPEYYEIAKARISHWQNIKKIA